MWDFTRGRCTTATSSPTPRVDRIYIPDMLFQVTDDGGRTLRPLGTRASTSTTTSIWVDPANADHMLVGNDGGLYRSWDARQDLELLRQPAAGAVLRCGVDNALPFYNIYGGCRTTIPWAAVADQVGSRDPQLRRLRDEGRRRLYVAHRSGRSQHHVRPIAARRAVALRPETSENVGINRSRRRASGVPLELGHAADRRPACAQATLHRGRNSSAARRSRRQVAQISPDLTRQIERNTLKMMGKVWGVDAVGQEHVDVELPNISAMSESPNKAGLL